MIRVAAVGDIHLGTDNVDAFTESVRPAERDADVLLLAGDLSRCGEQDEADLVCRSVGDLDLPVIAVLGNHDHHAGDADGFRARLESGGITVLEGEATVVDVDGCRVGVAGAKGFGGGFAGACASDFGEAEMKAFVGHTREVSARLGDALGSMEADVRIALLHYSPSEDTLRGERLEIFPFLGSYLLAEAIDEAGADLALHGHAHAGVEHGMTPGGTPVRNVAMPVIRSSYRVYELSSSDPASRSIEGRRISV
jgi:Icc-related predicted phosphoesterase